jgi:hypothetical protein
MVDPISDEERETFVRRLKLAFVLLVTLSAVLITLQSGAGPLALVLAGGSGAAVGVVLLWVAFPSTLSPGED